MQQGCYALIVARGKWERVEGLARHVVSPEKNPNFRSHTYISNVAAAVDARALRVHHALRYGKIYEYSLFVCFV